MLTLLKLSQKVGLVVSVIAVLAWLAVATVTARAVAGALWQYPRLAYSFAMCAAVIGGIGGLVGFWLVMDHVDYWRLGYRVRWIRANEWVYEERGAKSCETCLPYVRDVLARGYPEPCAIRIPSQASWESEVPTWARGRRAEIAGRIASSHGAHLGGKVELIG